MSVDYYAVLSVDRTAGSEEIKRAYFKRAGQYFSDRSEEKEACEKFRSCTEAYEVLSDENRRQLYDRSGYEGLKSSGYSGPADADEIFFSSLDFEAVLGLLSHGKPSLNDSPIEGRDQRHEAIRGMLGFGKPFRNDRPVEGRDLCHEITISFMEAVHGATKEISLTRRQPCRSCEGSGSSPGSQGEICSSCYGRGQVIRREEGNDVEERRGFGVGGLSSCPCPDCDGTGVHVTVPCPDCDGAGLIGEEKTLCFTIPAGVDNGTRIRMRGAGDGGRRGGSPGDLFVVIHVAEHAFFTRDGDTIYFPFLISSEDAARGARFEVPTVNGNRKLKIAAGSRSGTRIILKREGVPARHGGRSGDMVVILEAVPSTGLNDRQKEEQREKLREFAELTGVHLGAVEGEGVFFRIFHKAVGLMGALKS